MNFILIGFKNSGKTSLGESLAHELGFPFIDIDRLVENEDGRDLSCRDIVRASGEAYFRKLEKSIIQNLKSEGAVIASGGGAIVDPENIAHFKKMGKLIYLSLPFEILYQRCSASAVLPAFLDPAHPRESFARIYQDRLPIYREAADVILELGTENIEEMMRRFKEEVLDGQQ